MYLEHYKNRLDDIPSFLKKYLNVPSLCRLKRVGYFCGMDFASKNIYNFSEYISRYDHSLTVALMIYKLTGDKKVTIAGLLHDIATPCFSHVIDYMNGDYITQESTEEYTEKIILNDKELLGCLELDNIDVSDVVNFKKYSLVDLDRPCLCSDRLDGIILTGMGWTKNISLDDIDRIVNSMCVYKNENNLDEIGLNDLDVLKRVVEINDLINVYCQSMEDNYMMNLLADITRLGIKNNLFTYDDLYRLTEVELFFILDNCNISEIKELLSLFYNIKKEDIPDREMPKIKIRKINPIYRGSRWSDVKDI